MTEDTLIYIKRHQPDGVSGLILIMIGAIFIYFGLMINSHSTLEGSILIFWGICISIGFFVFPLLYKLNNNILMEILSASWCDEAHKVLKNRLLSGALRLQDLNEAIAIQEKYNQKAKNELVIEKINHFIQNLEK